MGNSIFDWDDDEKRESGQGAKFTDQKDESASENASWNDPWKNNYDEKPILELPTDSRDKKVENTWESPRWSDPWEDVATEKQVADEPVEYIPYQPETADETARRGGLAWSAGIVFFSSIVFMLFLGWGADLIFRSSPWGIIVGIVLGSIIGFIQFFRISSQIFNSAKAESAMRPLMPRDDEDNKR